MRFLSRAVPVEIGGNLRKLTILRFVGATFVIGAAIVARETGDGARSAGVLYGLLAAIYAVTAAVYLAVRAGAPLRALLPFEIAFDCAALTLTLHYSGGATSQFAVLYILPILAGGIYFQVAGGLATALLAAASYVGYTMLALGGIVNPGAGASVMSGETSAEAILRTCWSVAAFFLTGFLSGRLSTHVHRRGEELASKDRELTRVKLHTDSIITNVSSGLIVTNAAGEITTCNPAAIKILGLLPTDEIKGKLVADVLPHMSALVQELEKALATGTPRRRHEIEIRSKDGAALPLGISLSILKGENGEKRGVVAIFQDLTEVHHMRERVRRADKMAAIGELSTAIAHEIRAPLASICGSIEMLSGELELSGDNRKLMELIIKEADRLDRIITDFLEFARLKPPAFEPVDVARCLDEVLLLFTHSSELNRNVSFEVVCDAKDACIYADDEQIRQVYLNLIMNACEAMSEGGRFTIRIGLDVRPLRENGSPEECVVIDFENTGPAIPENVIPHIFEPFYSTKDGGTGLGLAIVSRIVESHLGHVRVTSDEDHGTKFSIELPVYSGSDAKHEEILKEEFISF
ncbi:MAG: ATP-binding protein [Candidatus Krumholzibacteriia bacterium]